jgi:hypothetical protein
MKQSAVGVMRQSPRGGLQAITGTPKTWPQPKKRTRGQEKWATPEIPRFEFHSTDENFMGIPSIRRLGNTGIRK